MIVGDGEAVREIASGWAGGIDAHLGQGEGLRVRRRVEDRTLRARDEYDVLLRPHARRDRPHDVADVEDVDVVFAKERAQEYFASGVFSLRDKADAEQLYLVTLNAISLAIRDDK